MFIALIIILTVIDIALFIAINSMKVGSYIRHRVKDIRAKNGEEQTTGGKVANTALNIAEFGAIESLKLFRLTVKLLRDACISMAGVILIVDIIVFFVISSSATWFLLYSGFYDEEGKEVASSETVEDGGNVGGGGLSGTSNSSGWYDFDMGGLPAGSSVRSLEVASGQTVNLYKGLPWATDSNTYFFNIEVAQGEIKNTFERAGVSFKQTGQIVNSDGMSGFKAVSNSNGLNSWCVCSLAPMVDKGYVTEGRMWKQATGLGDSTSANYKSKWAIVLVEKGKDKSDRSNWFSIPATRNDAKAHTALYGVFQTNVKVIGDHKYQISKNWSGSSYDNIDVAGDDPVNTIKTLNDYIKAHNSSSGWKNFTMGSWGACKVECYNTSARFIQEIDGNYDIIGYVVY